MLLPFALVHRDEQNVYRLHSAYAGLDDALETRKAKDQPPPAVEEKPKRRRLLESEPEAMAEPVGTPSAFWIVYDRMNLRVLEGDGSAGHCAEVTQGI